MIICKTNNIYAQTDYKPKYLRENDRTLLELTDNATDNGWLEFRQNAEAVDPERFFARFGKSIGLGADYQMRVVRDEADFKQVRHQRFQLFYKDIPVESIEYILHSRDKRLTVAQGRMVEDLSLDVSKPMPERKALELALADRGLTVEALKGSEKLPKAELLIAGLPNSYARQNFRLCYVFNLGAGAQRTDRKDERPREPERVYVDAASGEIFRRDPLTIRCFGSLTHQAKSVAPARSAGHDQKVSALLLGGTFRPIYPNRYGYADRSFEIEQTGSGYRLALPNTQLITRIAAGAQGANEIMTDLWNRSADVVHNSSNWGFVSQNATTAHWLGQQTLTYWSTRFARNGINGVGQYPHVLVNVPPIPGIENFNAYWDNNNTIAFRNPSGASPMITADIMGHEYAHAITQATANLQYVGESGAINESLSDIFGTAFERYLFPDPNTVNPTNWNWHLMEEWSTQRDMQNPGAHSQPSVYQGANWLPVTGNCGPFNDFCGVHTNSGVLNKWFHTLCTGQGPNGNVTPIGSFEEAIGIVYHAQRHYMQSNSQYYDARNAMVFAARALYGDCSPQERAVVNASIAVGLGVGVFNYHCSFACDYQANLMGPSTVSPGQTITLQAQCIGNPGANSDVCNYIIASFNGGTPTTNNTYSFQAPTTPGFYSYSVALIKPNSSCYTQTATTTVQVVGIASCDFSSGPRRVGSWNGLEVQIRSISGKNVLVTAIVGSPTDKYYPRGDNFWGSFTVDPGMAGLQSCLNAGNTDWNGLGLPNGLTPPSGYYQGAEEDGAAYFASNGPNPPNICDLSAGPRHLGTWNGMNVQMRQFPNGIRGLVVAVAGSSNDKYFPRGDNFWDNFTKDPGADQYRPCLNAGDSNWWGTAKPNSVTPPSGYQQGTTQDGSVFFSTNGLRVAATEPTMDDVSLVKVRPNPAQEELIVTIMLKEAADVPIRLLDLQGRVHQQHVLKGVIGQNERTLRIGTLPTGLYALEVVMGQERIIHKVVKE